MSYVIERARDPVASRMWWSKSAGFSLKFFKSLEAAFLWSSSYLSTVAILKNSWKSRRCVLHLSPYSNAVKAHLFRPISSTVGD